MKLKKEHFRLASNFLFHIVSVVIVFIAFLPIAKWYFSYKPLWGVDFYYTASLSNLLKNNFSLPPAGWGYGWFTGWPLMSNYPILHLYFIVPLISFFGLINSVKIWMLVSLFAFFAGLYACFYYLSKNFFLSVILTVSAIYSVSIYGSLAWGGSLPSHASQAFYPWTIFFLIVYLKTKKIRSLLSAAVISGISILGHPQIAIAYIFPTAFILMFFYFGNINFKKRIFSLIVFGIISVLIGLPVLYSSAGGLKSLIVTNSVEVASSTVKMEDTSTAKAVREFHKKQPLRIYTDNNKTIFFVLVLCLVVFIISFIFKRSKNFIFLVLPFLILSLFYVFYIWIFSYGISIYHGGWYRLFWSVPVWIGLLASSLWGLSEHYLFHRRFVLQVTVYSILSVVGVWSLINFSGNIFDGIIYRSQVSSAFPDILNLKTQGSEVTDLKKELLPDWLDATRTDYRFYSGDQTVNIWWNALFPMPLARGYLDPPSNRGYLFWLDASLSRDSKTHEDQLVGSFKYPPEIAYNNTLFLLNWYSVKFIEAGHAGPTAYSPIPASLDKNENFVHGPDTIDFNEEKYSKGNQTLVFYEVKDELVSPILNATNASTVGIFASDAGYETIIRAIADGNTNSDHLIPINMGQYADKYNLSELASMDALIFYDYKYSDKGKLFSNINKYVVGGKNVFIDTGGENPESKSKDLPSIFPFKSLTRTFLKDTWDFEINDSSYFENVDSSNFSPPVLDNSGWNFSYPDEGSLKSGAKVIVKDRGVPLMVTEDLGKGKLIWSGFNLPYHVARYHNKDEAVFFKNIINYLVGDTATSSVSSQSHFINSMKREIINDPAKGVLFKEQAYPGWGAKVEQSNKISNLKVWKAGPAEPGFMYVRIPDSCIKSKVVFSYSGSFIGWLVFLVSVVTFAFIFEEVAIGGILFGRSVRFVIRKGKKYVGKWWDRESGDSSDSA